MSKYSLRIKLLDLVNSYDVLTKLSRVAVSAKMAYTLGIVISAVNPKLELQQKAHLALLQRLGEKQDNGQYLVKPENQDQFDKEYADLISSDVRLDIGKIRLTAIEAEGIKLTPIDVYNLGWLLISDVETIFESENDLTEP